MTEKVKKIIIKSMSNTLATYITSFLIILSFEMVYRERSLYYLMTPIIILFFVSRVLIRQKNLNQLTHIDIETLCFDKDRKERAVQLVDCFCVIILLCQMILALTNNSEYINGKLLNDDNTAMLLLPAIAFLISLYYSIVKNKFYLKSLTILVTTFQGLLLFLFIVIKGLLFLMLFANKYLHFADNGVNSVNQEFYTQVILMAPIVVNIEVVFILLLGVASLLFQLLILYITPPYQLKVLENGYKALNIFIAIIGISGLLYSPYIVKKVEPLKSEAIIAMQNEEDPSYFLYYDKTQLIEAINKVNEGSYTKMITILFIPYTIGALFISLLLTLRISRCEKEAMKLMISIIDGENTISKYSIRRIIYLSNDKHFINIKMLEKNNVA